MTTRNEALVTWAADLASTPRVWRGAGFFHAFPRSSRADEAHMILFPQNKRQAKPGVFSTELPGNTAESAPGGSEEIVFLVMSVAVLHGVINHFRFLPGGGSRAFCRASSRSNCNTTFSRSAASSCRP